MKNYIKGIITGIIIGAVICSIPALADTIDALFNNVRISVNGVDQIQWGENIQLADGAETPASILYNGTTYLPMRKLGELSGNKIYWNGDSRTVGMTGAQKDIKVIAEKPDKNGNVWEYYTFKVSEYDKRKEGTMATSYYSDFYYLGVKDEARGYERVYHIATPLGAGDNVRVTDDAVYFVDDVHDKLKKIGFNNDANSQDGEIFDADFMRVRAASFEGDLVYFYAYEQYSLSNTGRICVYDYINKRYAQHRLNGSWPKAINIRTVSTEDKIIFIYELIASGGINQGDYEVIFDKNTFKFDKAQKVETTEVEEME